jgi:cysteinyl-tRNA synthetase
MVQRLVDHGHAYESGGSVWFDVRSYEEYGKLSGQNPDEMRSSPDLGVKRNALDFALWKAVKPGEPAWESPWGEGRPGWHIECSAMAYDHFGPTLDIHGGGMDLKFPHHENEIAQSCCANKANYARYWMHNGLLVLQKPPGEDGPAAKMGKSKNNAFGVRDALSQYPAEALRLHYLGTHYRTPLPWGPDSFSESLANLARLYEARDVAQSMQGSESAEDVIASLGDDAAEVYRLGLTFPERFYAAMDDDLNTAKALGAAFELARAINRFANHKKARKRGGPVVAPALDALVLLNVIGLLSLDGAAFQDEVKAKRLGAMGVSQEQVEDLLRQRAEARASKDWARADEIRAELTSLRIVVMDRADGVDWRVQLVDDE